MRSAGVMADVVGFGASFSGSEVGAACAKANAGQQVTADSAARRTRENDIQNSEIERWSGPPVKVALKGGPHCQENVGQTAWYGRSPLICGPVRERRSI